MQRNMETTEQSLRSVVGGGLLATALVTSSPARLGLLGPSVD
ncbi:hypothetical protein [Deinococcus radiophilus]|nr:hypothetical protein [Deinococcus radiophilus]